MYKENQKEENQNISSYQRNKPFGLSFNRSNYKYRKSMVQETVYQVNNHRVIEISCFFYCGKPGHYARNCFSNPKRQPDQKLNGQNRSKSKPRETTPWTSDTKFGNNRPFPDLALN